MTFPLSILNLSLLDAGSTGAQALQNTVELARYADQRGYTRYWLAEHHNMANVASSTPEILIERIACATTNMRIGSGGIMLMNHSPLKVVETFRVLAALHPGRIDLGIGRAFGTDDTTVLALRSTQPSLDRNAFSAQLTELFAFATGQFPPDHPFQSVRAVPTDVELPPIWLLGSSRRSAELAATLGLGFAFAHHINPMDAVQVMRFYRETFVPSHYLKEPKAILAVAVVCAETDERAEQLAASVDFAWLGIQKGRPQPLVSVEDALAYPYSWRERERLRANRSRLLVGSQTKVQAQLSELIKQTVADELMVTVEIYGHENRVQVYKLLAEAFDL